MSLMEQFKADGYYDILKNPAYQNGHGLLNDEGVKALKELDARVAAKRAAERAAREAQQVTLDFRRPAVAKSTSSSLPFPLRNAVRDGLYELTAPDNRARMNELYRDYIGGPMYGYAAAAAPYVPAMVGGAYAAAPIVSGMRDYHDYQTMPRDEFYARKLEYMPED